MDIVRPPTCGQCAHWHIIPQNPQAIRPAGQREGQCREELKLVSVLTPQGTTLMNLFAQVPEFHPICGRFVSRGGQPPKEV